MKKFDLKKFLAENKATFFSSLTEGDLMQNIGKGLEYEATEEMIRDYADRLLGAGVDDVEDLANYYLNNPEELPEPMEYEFFENNFDDILSLAMTGLNEGYDEFKRAEKGSKDVTAKDKGEEEVYGAGVKKGEEIEKKKMKVSELKAKIKENSDPRMDSAYVKYDTLYDFVDQKMVEGDDEAEALLKSKPSYDDLYDFVDQKMVEGDDEAEALLNKINKVNESKSSKMKVSDLKAKIKEMVLSEMALDVDKMEDAPEDEVDFLAELEGMLKESPMDDPRVEEIIQMLNDMDVDGETMEYILRQVGMEDQMASQLVRNKMELDSVNEMKTMMGSKFDEEEYEGSDDHFQDTIDESGLWTALMKFKDEGFSLEHVVGWIEANWYMIKEADEKAADEEAAADVTVDDTETTDVETTAEVNPNVKAVQDSLTQAQAAAQKLGDKKLIDQIGNTITFFTRTHVVEKPGTTA